MLLGGDINSSMHAAPAAATHLRGSLPAGPAQRAQAGPHRAACQVHGQQALLLPGPHKRQHLQLGEPRHRLCHRWRPLGAQVQAAEGRRGVPQQLRHLGLCQLDSLC